ncbi:unnamed protein product [Amoebophrya sp. A120]|nr:unnamed protein product [Amoebophrya sp. A120]|eukprot:GSA120T00009540001.1
MQHAAHGAAPPLTGRGTQTMRERVPVSGSPACLSRITAKRDGKWWQHHREGGRASMPARRGPRVRGARVFRGRPCPSAGGPMGGRLCRLFQHPPTNRGRPTETARRPRQHRLDVLARGRRPNHGRAPPCPMAARQVAPSEREPPTRGPVGRPLGRASLLGGACVVLGCAGRPAWIFASIRDSRSPPIVCRRAGCFLRAAELHENGGHFSRSCGLASGCSRACVS